MTGYGLDSQQTGVWFPTCISFLQRSDRLGGSPTVVSNGNRVLFPLGLSDRSVTLITHLYLVPTLRMIGPIPPVTRLHPVVINWLSTVTALILFMSKSYFVPFILDPLQCTMGKIFGIVWEQFYNDNFKTMMSLPIVETFSCSPPSLKGYLCSDVQWRLFRFCCRIGWEFVCHFETNVGSATAWSSSSPYHLFHALLPCIINPYPLSPTLRVSRFHFPSCRSRKMTPSPCSLFTLHSRFCKEPWSHLWEVPFFTVPFTVQLL
jgi:hypothetical protein